MADFGFSTTGDEVVGCFRDTVRGKTILITGASTGGLGAETALSLAKGQPVQLILLARNLGKVQPVIDKIKDIDSSVEAHFIPVELDKIASIQGAVKEIESKSSITKIDIVINNAGIMATPYRKNDAGIESQLATNHVGHFYLTKHLQPWIKAAGEGARIINVSSDGYMISDFRFGDYNFSDGRDYDRWSGYGQSKTANILFSRQLGKKLASVGVKSFSVHPGVIFSTSLSNSIDPSLFNEVPAIAKKNTGVDFKMGQPKSAQQGVATTLVAALDPSIADKTGSFMTDCKIITPFEYASSADNAEKLWTLTEELIGEKWDLDAWA